MEKAAFFRRASGRRRLVLYPLKLELLAVHDHQECISHHKQSISSNCLKNELVECSLDVKRSFISLYHCPVRHKFTTRKKRKIAFHVEEHDYQIYKAL